MEVKLGSLELDCLVNNFFCFPLGGACCWWLYLLFLSLENIETNVTSRLTISWANSQPWYNTAKYSAHLEFQLESPMCPLLNYNFPYLHVLFTFILNEIFNTLFTTFFYEHHGKLPTTVQTHGVLGYLFVSFPVMVCTWSLLFFYWHSSS